MKFSSAGIRDWFGKAFNTSVLQDKRLQWVDYLRGIAIVLVVYRHALLGIERSNIPVPTFFSDANMVFYSFRMPLFFILSGIFISRSLAKKPVRELIGIKFENLLYPYFIWAFLQVTLQVIFGQFTNSHRSLVDYSYILYHPRYLDQFWYLPALFNTTLIYVLIKSRFKPAASSQVIFGLMLYYFSPYFQRVSMVSDWMEFYIFFALGDACSRIFFRDSSQRIFKSAKTFLLIIPLFCAAQWYYLKYDIGNTTLLTDLHTIKENYINHLYSQTTFLFIALIGCIAMFNLAFLLHRFGVLPFLRVLGFHSLYIYVMHVIVTGFIRLVLPPVFGVHDPTALLLCGIFFGLALPIVVYNLLIKDGVLWFLFSFRKRSPKQQKAQDVRPTIVSTTTIH